MGTPVVTVASGGIAVTEVANGLPIDESTTGGMAVTVVSSGGLGVTFGTGGGFPSVSGRRLVFAQMGDSRTNQGHSSGRLASYTHGWQFWAENYSNGGLWFPANLNFGVNSDTTSGMRARFSDVTSSGADAVSILAGTNNWGAGISLAQTLSDLEAMVAAARAARMGVLLIAEMPRGDTSFPARRLAGDDLTNHYAVRDWCLAQAGRPGVIVHNPWTYLAVEGSPTGDAIVGKLYDGLHESQRGAKDMGDGIGASLASVTPSVTVLLPSDGSNLVTNPFLTGADAASGGATGNEPTGMAILTLPTGLTVVGATQQSRNGFDDWFKLTIGGTPTGASPTLTARMAISSGFAAGDVLEAAAQVEVEAGATSLLYASFAARATGSVTETFEAGTSIDTYRSDIAEAWGGPQVAPHGTLSSGVTGLSAQLSARFTQNVAASAVIWTRAWCSRQIL